MDQKEVVHVSDISLDPEPFLNKVIHRIQIADAGDLNHLRAGIISVRFCVLLTHDLNSTHGDIRIESIPEQPFCDVVPHMLVIAMYIALEDIKIRAMLPESSTQELLHPISGAVCALALLTGLIVFDEAAGHTVIDAVII